MYSTIRLYCAIVALMLPFGCHNNPPDHPDRDLVVDGGDPQAPCWDCVHASCASAEGACLADPGCADYVACLQRCPHGAEAEAQCDCSPPSTAAGKAAQADLTACRAAGACAQICTGRPPDRWNNSTCQDPVCHQMCMPPEQTDMALDKCLKCELTYCCDTRKACKDEPQCEELRQHYLDCVSQPDKEACKLKWYEMLPKGLAVFAPRTACTELFCADADGCGNTKIDPCVECVITECRTETAGCDTDPECVKIKQCYRAMNCNDQTCVKQCTDRYPQGADRFNTWSHCGQSKCQTKCLAN
jgi:hypothetical protein